MTDFDLKPEEQLAQEVSREQVAKQVLNNPEFKKFFIEYKDDLFDKIIRTEGEDIKKREECYRQLKSLGIMEAKLIRSIQTGKMARDQLSRMQKLAESAKNVIGLR